MNAKLRQCVFAYFVSSLLVLCGLSFFLPAEANQDSKVLSLVDGWAASLVVDAALVGESSSHPTALRITYFAMIALAVSGALALAISIRKSARPLASFLPPGIKLSGGFMFLAALLVVSTPFLPLGSVDLPLVRSIQEGIGHARVGLAIWSCLFFIAQATMWLFIFDYLFSKMRRA